MTERRIVYKLEDTLTTQGIWYEQELDKSTKLYELSGAVYLSIPSKQTIVDCNTGENFSITQIKDIDNKIAEIYPEHKYLYMYVNTYKFPS